MPSSGRFEKLGEIVSHDLLIFWKLIASCIECAPGLILCPQEGYGEEQSTIEQSVADGDVPYVAGPFLLHDIKPKMAMDTEYFLREINMILSCLKNKGLKIVPLAELLGRPVMVRIKSN